MSGCKRSISAVLVMLSWLASTNILADSIDGQYVAGYEVIYVDRSLNDQSRVGDTDVFSMVVEDGKLVDIIVDGDPDFNRASRSYEDIRIDTNARTAKGVIKQKSSEQGMQIRVELITDIIFGEKTFVGTVDIKLISAGGRSFNKIVEKGVFEGIKVQK